VRRIRPIKYEDRLSVVDHLDELRSRLIVCALAFVVAWAFTAWQNDLVLEIVNAPLPDGPRGEQIEPITLGPAEAFYTTLTNAAYAALLIALPVILYQLYAFILPAFSPTERRVATPLLLLIPLLFVGGVVFCYFAMGIGFQIPVGVLAACKLGVTSAEKLRRSRRYAIVAIVVLASLLPTLDPLTLILESIPLYALYELSILMAAAWGNPVSEVREEPAPEGTG
jgi:Sec-independent protein secretion pathway component TatC